MTRTFVVGAFVLAVLACNGVDYGAPTNSNIGTRNVTIKDSAFKPGTVRPDTLGQVVWTWSDGGVAHNVTFEDTTIGNSGDQTAGTFTRTFVTPGTYRFRCTNHSTAFGSGMHGTVVIGVAAPPDTGGGYGY